VIFNSDLNLNRPGNRKSKWSDSDGTIRGDLMGTKAFTSTMRTASGEAGGCLGTLAFILALYLLYGVVANSWPACGLLGVAAFAAYVLRDRESPWARAARKIAVSSAIGYGVLTAVLLLFNLILLA
jgi:hypothetical protein